MKLAELKDYIENEHDNDIVQKMTIDNVAKEYLYSMEEEGYLILKDGTETIYTFFDKSQLPKEEKEITIEVPKEKVYDIIKSKNTCLYW